MRNSRALRFVPLAAFFIMFVMTKAGAQNLVPNFDFEIGTICNVGPGSWGSVANWYIIGNHGGSPDYHHACNNGSTFGVPSNVFGNEPAYSGSAYAGFVTYFVSANFREYLQVQLTSPLTNGLSYSVTAWSSLGDIFGWAADGLGFHFTTNAITGTGTNTALNITATVENPVNNFINTQVGWQQVGGTFVASGGEQYLTIGNFKNDANTNIQVINSNANWCYIYIENVIVQPSIVLSAEIDHFSGDFFGHQVMLDWSTLTESGLSAFEVQRSIGDTRNFQSIGTVDAKGAPSVLTAYNYYDTEASLDQVNYYRLKEIDQDGQGGYSVTIAVASPEISQETSMQIYPNPMASGDALQIELLSPDNMEGEIKIIDMMGRMVYHEQIRAEAGRKELSIQSPELVPGQYTVILSGPSGNVQKRLIVH